MALPAGFVEVHAIQAPPFLAPGDLRAGAVVKYLKTREAVATDDTEDEQLRQFISETGTGVMVHEFKTRGGQGLVFKLRGSPSLDAKLCAIRLGWVAWLQFQPNREWTVAVATDLRQLRELLIRNRALDDELDREICERAGAFRRRPREGGLEGTSEPREPYRRAADDESLATPFAAVAKVRELLAFGSCMLSDVRRAVLADGHTLEQLHRALQEIGVRLGRPRTVGGKKYPTLYIPSGDDPVRLTRVGLAAIRAALARDMEESGDVERAGAVNDEQLGAVAPELDYHRWPDDDEGDDEEDDGSFLDEDEDGTLEELFQRHRERESDAPSSEAPDARSSARENGAGAAAELSDVQTSSRTEVEPAAVDRLSDELNAAIDEMLRGPIVPRAPGDPEPRIMTDEEIAEQLSRPFPALQATKPPRQLSPDAPACVKLRELLSDGPRPVVDVEREMVTAGFRVSLMKEARRVLGVQSRHMKTESGRRWEISLPTLPAVSSSSEAPAPAPPRPAPHGWLYEQLEDGPRRLADLRRAMPAPDDLDQVARDEIFVGMVRDAWAVVRRGPRRLGGFWLERGPMNLEASEAIVDAVRAAMRREGSPHIAYPKPKAWY